MTVIGVLNSALPPVFSCSFQLVTSAVNDSWIGQPVLLRPDIPWTGTEITSDKYFGASGLFNDVNGKIPQNVTKITVPLVLTPNSATYYQGGDVYAGWWIKDHWQYDYYVWQDAYGDPDDWTYLYLGADATFSVKETCSVPTNQSAFTGFKDLVKATATRHVPK